MRLSEFLSKASRGSRDRTMSCISEQGVFILESCTFWQRIDDLFVSRQHRLYSSRTLKAHKTRSHQVQANDRNDLHEGRCLIQQRTHQHQQRRARTRRQAADTSTVQSTCSMSSLSPSSKFTMCFATLVLICLLPAYCMDKIVSSNQRRHLIEPYANLVSHRQQQWPQAQVSTTYPINLFERSGLTVPMQFRHQYLSPLWWPQVMSAAATMFQQQHQQVNGLPMAFGPIENNMRPPLVSALQQVQVPMRASSSMNHVGRRRQDRSIDEDRNLGHNSIQVTGPQKQLQPHHHLEQQQQWRSLSIPTGVPQVSSSDINREQQTQQQHSVGGKLLVCYYVNRHNAPPMAGAREFLVPTATTTAAHAIDAAANRLLQTNIVNVDSDSTNGNGNSIPSGHSQYEDNQMLSRPHDNIAMILPMDTAATDYLPASPSDLRPTQQQQRTPAARPFEPMLDWRFGGNSTVAKDLKLRPIDTGKAVVVGGSIDVGGNSTMSSPFPIPYATETTPTFWSHNSGGLLAGTNPIVMQPASLYSSSLMQPSSFSGRVGGSSIGGNGSSNVNDKNNNAFKRHIVNTINGSMNDNNNRVNTSSQQERRQQLVSAPSSMSHAAIIVSGNSNGNVNGNTSYLPSTATTMLASESKQVQYKQQVFPTDNNKNELSDTRSHLFIPSNYRKRAFASNTNDYFSLDGHNYRQQQQQQQQQHQKCSSTRSHQHHNQLPPAAQTDSPAMITYRSPESSQQQTGGPLGGPFSNSNVLGGPLPTGASRQQQAAAGVLFASSPTQIHQSSALRPVFPTPQQQQYLSSVRMPNKSDAAILRSAPANRRSHQQHTPDHYPQQQQFVGSYKLTSGGSAPLVASASGDQLIVANAPPRSSLPKMLLSTSVNNGLGNYLVPTTTTAAASLSPSYEVSHHQHHHHLSHLPAIDARGSFNPLSDASYLIKGAGSGSTDGATSAAATNTVTFMTSPQVATATTTPHIAPSPNPTSSLAQSQSSTALTTPQSPASSSTTTLSIANGSSTDATGSGSPIVATDHLLSSRPPVASSAAASSSAVTTSSTTTRVSDSAYKQVTTNSGASSEKNAKLVATTSTTATPPTPLASSSSNQQHQHHATKSNGSPSPASSSSPFSTMLDVLGVASQYLMRFKPSSLISPTSFVAPFNSQHASIMSQSPANPIANIVGSDHFHSGGADVGHNGNSNSYQQHPYHHFQLLNQNSNNNTISSVTDNQVPRTPAASLSSSLLSTVQRPIASLAAAATGGSAAMAAMGSPLSSDRSSKAASASSSPGSSSSGSFLSRLSLQTKQRREDVCGRTIQIPERRIIGGEGARYGEFPYQVHIKISKHQCGGALVDRRSIVTAAHCVYHFITRAPVSKLQIVIGAYDIEDDQYQELPPQYFKVNKVKLHPNFRFSASHPDRYDIAILKLDKPVKYTDNVLPVCLPSKDLKFENMIGTVTGFGKTDPSLSNRYGTRLLQKVDVPIIENSECEQWHRTRGIDLRIFPEMMCAGYEDGLKDACVGDSGGPLVVKTPSGPNGSFRWTLAGITSAGFGCAQSRQPGIYHRVSHTVDWILENLD